MPGGQHDSSRTRVGPFFGYLLDRDPSGQSWLPKLLTLPTGGSPRPDASSLGPLVEHAWWPDERALDPPPSLLSWLVRNLECPSSMKADQIRSERRDLIEKDPQRVTEALQLLETRPATRDWYVMEGPSYPDAYLATGEAVVVVEGKRTESGPTESTTTWMAVRHQILRHLDAALGPAGPRALWGFFMVEGPEDGSVPPVWLDACASTLEPEILRRSLPHRSPGERELIAAGFLGVVTWQRACQELGVPLEELPDTVPANDE